VLNANMRAQTEYTPPLHKYARPPSAVAFLFSPPGDNTGTTDTVSRDIALIVPECRSFRRSSPRRNNVSASPTPLTLLNDAAESFTTPLAPAFFLFRCM